MVKKSVNIPYVDQWKPDEDDIYFTNSKDIIIAPVGKLYHIEESNNMINFFFIKPKKSYNSDLLRDHCCDYLNYFEKYFDEEKEYFTNLSFIKFMIDCYQDYNANNVIFDINRYILQPSIYNKITKMVDYNYNLELLYKSANNPQLQYTDEHAKTLLKISLMMNLCIPLITHFAYCRKVTDIDEFLLDIYDNILYYPEFDNAVNIFSKLYETSSSNVNRNVKNNLVIWAKLGQHIQ